LLATETVRGPGPGAGNGLVRLADIG
jgi:hypothetical protein